MGTKSIKEFSVSELKSRLDAGDEIFLLDVREPSEAEAASIGGTLIPLGQLPERVNEVPRDRVVVIYCRSGGRSDYAVNLLRQAHNFSNVFNLRGGILAWAELIDPALQEKLR